MITRFIARPGPFLEKARLVFPIILGTVVEYYDYALYGFCASLFAELFFPASDPTTALLKVFGIFLLGSLSKPLGAMVFGSIGDRYGRAVALKISMVGIALPTILIAFLPTYAQIGYLAPLLLLCCRVIQGMCTAGESDGVRIFIYESVGENYPCLANSFSGICCLLGIYLASCSAAYFLPLNAYRLAFLLGGFMGVIVFLSRHWLTETDFFINRVEPEKKTGHYQFWKIILKNKKPVLSAVLLCGSVGGIYHFYLVFLSNYLGTVLEMIELSTMSCYTSQGILLYTIFSPIAAVVADHFGPERVLKNASGMLFCVVLLNVFILSNNIFPFWLMAITIISLSFFQAPIFVVVVEKLTVQERYRCWSFGHSVGSMLFSGSAPIISLWLWNQSGSQLSPLFYFIFLVSLGVFAVGLLEK